MSRRLSNFFGFSSSNTNDDAASVSSEQSGSVSTGDMSMSKRRSTFGISLGISDSGDDNIDERIRNLYINPEILESMCMRSVKDLKFSNTEVGLPSSSFENNNKLSFHDEEERTVDDIPKDFFDPLYDPVKVFINDISSAGEDERNEYFMDKILEVDEDKDIVVAKLSDMIQDSYGDLMECMTNVNNVDTDLTSAVLQIREGRDRIKKATSFLMNGQIKICQLQKRRDNISLLIDGAKSLKYTKDIFRSAQLNIVTGDVGRAGEYIRIILKGMKNGEYKKFKALNQIENESRKCIQVIRQKADKALQRLCCRKFAISEYFNIIKAYLVLDDIHDNLGENISVSTNDIRAFDHLGCLESLPQKIQQFHMDDIDNCIHTAMLEFIYANQHKKLKAAAEVGSFSPTSSADVLDLAELPLFQLYQRLSPESVASSVMRSCELFADSIFTHYQITEWHNSTNTSDDSDWTEYEYERLQNVSNKIIESRAVLWDDLLRGLAEMFNTVAITAAVSIDDFLGILWAVEMMTTIGNEFCGANSVALLICIEAKSKEYVHFVHTESFQLLQQLIENDPWENVPINISDYGGVIGILKSKVQVSRNENSLMKLILRAQENGFPGLSNLDTSTNSHLVLTSFAKHGNPFHFMTDDESEAIKSTDSGQKQSILDDASTYLSNILDAPLRNGNTAISPISKRNQQINDSLVVTQSVLNGLARFTGKYLQIMHLIPKSALTLWLRLKDLYDYYLCYVYMSFVPNDDRNKFMSKPNKMGLPSPDQFKEFEELHKYIEHALNIDIEKPASVTTDSESTTTSNHSGSEIAGLKNVEKIKLISLIGTTKPILYNGDDGKFSDMNHHIVAGESCWFAARILNEIKDILTSMLGKSGDSCVEYISQYQVVASQLRSMIYKTLCPQLVKHSWLLSQIEAGAWDSKKLRDTHHTWVDIVVSNSKNVYDYLCMETNFADASVLVQEQLWLELCQSIFDTVLEGFAKIRKLTNEGRAVMTMDVAALHDGLDSIHNCRPPRGKYHLNNFIRATYLSEEDTSKWVQENWQSYSYRQIHGLLTLNLTSMLNSKKLKDAIAALDSLYAANSSSWQVPRIAEIFDGKANDDAPTLTSRIGHRLSTLRLPDTKM